MAQRIDLVRILRDANRPLGVMELIRLGGLHPGQQTEVKRQLRALIRGGDVAKAGKRFVVAEQGVSPSERSPGRGGRAPKAQERTARRPASTRGKGRPERLVEGLLHVHRNGFGFVHPTSGEGENIFVPPHEASRALDKDRVVVSLEEERGRTTGRIVRVVDRKRELLVGRYVEQGRGAIVEPIDPGLPGPVQVPKTQMARHGDMVKVRLGVGKTLLSDVEGLVGEVAGSLGEPGSYSAEVLSVAFAHGFSDEFPAAVMDEADGVSLTVPVDEVLAEGRRDLRSLPLVTIDGEDARDFDDAICVEADSDGFRLWVAIADVTHYVREGTALDAEALRRATSVYLPDRVLPMLPERLSNGICSLKPDEDRLCMVAEMRFNRTGEVKESDLYPAVMRSAARCTYREVQDVLDGKDVPHRNAFKPHFERATKLAQALTKMRQRRGAIEFDFPETKIILDEEGNPLRLERRERQDSHRLIEECMLAANEAVARYFQDKQLPSIYRFHGDPDPEKLEAFATLAAAHGFHLPRGKVSSRELNALLERLSGHPEERILSQLLLRSMMQAIYSAEDVGHYGLAAEHYLHFTSPIRRYPDLVVHRLLKQHWGERGGDADAETDRLTAIAAQSSERERAAVSVEREVMSFYATILMKDRVGEEFLGTVVSVTDFGFFVELDDIFVEGLVRSDTLGGRARLDPVLHALVFANGRRVRVGHRACVRLISANAARRQLDLEVVRFEGKRGLPRKEERVGPRRDERPARTEAERPRRRTEERPARLERDGRKRRDNKRPVRLEGERPARRAPEQEAAPRNEQRAPSAHPGFDRMRREAQGKKGATKGRGSWRGKRR